MDKNLDLYKKFEEQNKNDKRDIKIIQEDNIVYVHISANVKKANIELNNKIYFQVINIRKEPMIFNLNISTKKMTCSKLLYIEYIDINDVSRKVGFTLYYVAKNSIGIYDEKLKELGIEYSNLGKVDVISQRTIYITLKKLISAYDIKGMLKVVWIYKSDNISAGHALRLTESGMYSEMRINKVQINNKSKELDLEYVVAHEFGHILIDYLSFKKNNILPGEKDPKYYEKVYNDNIEISEKICANISEKDKEKFISQYATINGRECIAEAFAMWATKKNNNSVIISLMLDILEGISDK